MSALSGGISNLLRSFGGFQPQAGQSAGGLFSGGNIAALRNLIANPQSLESSIYGALGGIRPQAGQPAGGLFSGSNIGALQGLLGNVLRGGGNWQTGWDGRPHLLPPGAMSFAGGGVPGIPQGAMFAPVQDPLADRYSMLGALARYRMM